jgi:hypothetical protein
LDFEGFFVERKTGGRACHVVLVLDERVGDPAAGEKDYQGYAQR